MLLEIQSQLPTTCPTVRWANNQGHPGSNPTQMGEWDIAALKTGDSWNVVSRKTRIPYSTVKKHARALGYEPKRALAIEIPDG